MADINANMSCFDVLILPYWIELFTNVNLVYNSGTLHSNSCH